MDDLYEGWKQMHNRDSFNRYQMLMPKHVVKTLKTSCKTREMARRGEVLRT